MEVGMLKWDSFFLVSVPDDEATGPTAQLDDRFCIKKCDTWQTIGEQSQWNKQTWVVLPFAFYVKNLSFYMFFFILKLKFIQNFRDDVIFCNQYSCSEPPPNGLLCKKKHAVCHVFAGVRFVDNGT